MRQGPASSVAREALIRVAYDSAKDRFPVDFEHFCDMVCDWDAEPVHVDGELVGAVLIRYNEIHACIKPAGFRRWLTKGVLRRTLGKVLHDYGVAVTKVTADNAVGRAFVERLGFKPVRVADGIITYEASNGD